MPYTRHAQAYRSTLDGPIQFMPFEIWRDTTTGASYFVPNVVVGETLQSSSGIGVLPTQVDSIEFMPNDHKFYSQGTLMFQYQHSSEE